MNIIAVETFWTLKIRHVTFEPTTRRYDGENGEMFNNFYLISFRAVRVRIMHCENTGLNTHDITLNTPNIRVRQQDPPPKGGNRTSDRVYHVCVQHMTHAIVRHGQPNMYSLCTTGFFSAFWPTKLRTRPWRHVNSWSLRNARNRCKPRRETRFLINELLKRTDDNFGVKEWCIKKGWLCMSRGALTGASPKEKFSVFLEIIIIIIK